MWGRSPLCCMNRPPQPISPPALTDARKILCINMAGGRPCSSGRSADNNRCRSARVIPFTPLLPACQHSRGKHMDLLTATVLKQGKRLHSNAADGECGKERLILGLNVVWWCQRLDILYKCGHSDPGGCTVKGKMMQPRVPGTHEYWKILSHYIFFQCHLSVEVESKVWPFYSLANSKARHVWGMGRWEDK